MNSSAAVTVPARVYTGAAAEGSTRTYEGPATAIAAPGGASKTVPSYNALKEYQSHVRPYQQRRHRDLPHVIDVGQEGQGLPRARQGREEVTAAVPLEAPIVDFDKVSADIAAVLVQHGVVAPENIRITLTTLGHGDRTGVQVTAFGDPATTRPHGREDDVFDAIVGQIREAS